MSIQTYSFTRADLVNAFAKWAADHRAGNTRSHAEADATPVDELAEANADTLLEHLAATQDFPLGKACDLSGEGECEACQ